MTAILNSLIAVLGAWLIITPYPFGSHGVALAVAMAAGAALLILGICAFRQKEYKPALDYAIAAIGAALAVWGVIGAVMGLGSGANEVLVGLIAAALAFIATRFTTTYKTASFYDRGGAPMVDVQSLRYKDGDILMKALLLQSMPSTVYVKPDEVWKVLTMVPFDLIKQMPGFLYRGYKICKEQEAKGE